MNKYASIMLEVNGYYVLFNNNEPFTHVKKCMVVEIDDKVYLNKYVYNINCDEWKFSWYAIWVMITHYSRDVGK